jgi:hypothetical protein
MKYIIPENKLDKIVFRYLDLKLEGLVKKTPNRYDGIIFAYPDEQYGMLGWKNDGTLYIYYELTEEISSTFGLDESDSELLIGRWVEDRLQLNVITPIFPYTTSMLSSYVEKIDTD